MYLHIIHTNWLVILFYQGRVPWKQQAWTHANTQTCIYKEKRKCSTSDQASSASREPLLSFLQNRPNAAQKRPSAAHKKPQQQRPNAELHKRDGTRRHNATTHLRREFHGGNLVMIHAATLPFRYCLSKQTCEFTKKRHNTTTNPRRESWKIKMSKRLFCTNVQDMILKRQEKDMLQKRICGADSEETAFTVYALLVKSSRVARAQFARLAENTKRVLMQKHLRGANSMEAESKKKKRQPSCRTRCWVNFPCCSHLICLFGCCAGFALQTSRPNEQTAWICSTVGAAPSYQGNSLASRIRSDYLSTWIRWTEQSAPLVCSCGVRLDSLGFAQQAPRYDSASYKGDGSANLFCAALGLVCAAYSLFCAALGLFCCGLFVQYKVSFVQQIGFAWSGWTLGFGEQSSLRVWSARLECDRIRSDSLRSTQQSPWYDSTFAFCSAYICKVYI